MSPRPRKTAAATSPKPKKASSKADTGVVRTELDTLAGAVASSNDSWASLATDLNQRLSALEGKQPTVDNMWEGHSSLMVRVAGLIDRADELEEGSKIVIAQAREAQVKAAANAQKIEVVAQNLSDVGRRVQQAESELVRHRAFHSAHGAEALTEAARAEVSKVWQAIVWGYIALTGLGAFALIRTF